jgi:putative ABC transport system substrate-binding protein
MINRRELNILLGGAAAAWPLAGSAQQARMRRLSVLMSLAENDPEAQARIAALARGLRDLGWIERRNLRTEYRGIVGGGIDPIRVAVAQVVASSPDVVHTNNTTIVQELQRQKRSIPIVFAGIVDPVETGGGRELAAPRRQRDWIYESRTCFRRKKIGISQGGRAGLEPGAGPDE